MTPRREALLALAGLCLVAAGALLVARSHGPAHEVRIAGATVRILEPAHSPQIGVAIVFHGLSANRVVMQQSGQWLAAQGFRTFLVESPGHGNSSARFSHTAALESALRVLAELLRTREVDSQTTVLVGHSLGGELAIRLADFFPAAGTIALSPAPMVLPRRPPANLLVLGAQFDLPPMKEVARKALEVAGAKKIGNSDFAKGEAADHVELRWATHTTVVLDPRASAQMARWAIRSVGSGQSQRVPAGLPLLGEGMGVAGLCLLFPFVTRHVLRFAGMHRRTPALPDAVAKLPGTATIFAAWAAAALGAVALANAWHPHRIFPFYTGSYLVSFLFLTGMLLWFVFGASAWKCFSAAPGTPSRPVAAPVTGPVASVAAAIALGLMVIWIFGAWLSWQLTDVLMTSERWLCVPPLIVATLAYTLIEETMLGPLTKDNAVRRFATYIGLRAILWLALLGGILVLLNGEMMTAVLAPYFLTVSLGQRLGADVILRRQGTPLSASLFSAILGAWFVAAVLPLA